MDKHISANINFDWSLDPKKLKDIYDQTDFDSIFSKHIAEDVKGACFNDERMQVNLLEPLERFVYGLDSNASRDDIDKAIIYIRSLNKASKLCRRALKPGDVIFSCNDCSLDVTCVVCLDCFHKSAHKDHNYRMSNSDGGGCCDCGDVEAWKQHHACTDHLIPDQPNLTLSDYEDEQLRSRQILLDKEHNLEKINRLPPNVAANYYMACQASLQYAQKILTWVNYDYLPEEKEEYMEIIRQRKDKSSKNYYTVVYNDEVHTYDHVINTLVKIIKCTKMAASVLASTVSREGRALVLKDNYDKCEQVKHLITNVRDGGPGSLRVEVIHNSVLRHQSYAQKLLEWITQMADSSDAFRILTAYVLFGKSNLVDGDLTLVENVMLSNTTYWKMARVEWNDLFVTSLLSEYSIKDQFARLLTRNYPRLMQDFIKDDHDHSVSILTMTTQLYTVPSLICMLVEEENALAIIAQTLIDTCKSTHRENRNISYEHRNTFDMQSLKRGFYIISDLKYLINIEPTKWTDRLRKNVIEAVNLFLSLLNTMQGMDSVKRQLGQHLEYEPDWESGMSLQNRLIQLITRFVTYCSFDDEVLLASLKETQMRLFKNGGYKTTTKEFFNYQVSLIQYDVSTSPVSVHLPLTRFAAALILELMKRKPSDKVPYDQSLVLLVNQENDSKYSMIDIMEPSLRTEVMIAQFRSGMWRRNGYSLVNQIIYFHGPLMRKEMFDRDILVLQECAAMCEANEFIIHLLNKFQLLYWVSLDSIRGPGAETKAISVHNEEEILAQIMSLGEEFLQLLLTIISERYCIGVGEIEEEDIMKNEIIQLLCISPSTRSDLTHKLYVNDNEIDCIKSVANLKRSNEASTGKYELKEEYYKRYNPFFYHYNRREQSNALAAQLKRKQSLREELICCPPPKPVQLTKQFSNLNELLKCEITLILIKKILQRALTQPNQEGLTKVPLKFSASDLQLDQTLHLIGLGLHEQERSPLTFKYIEAAYDADIFTALQECYEKTRRSRDLILWLMKKSYELIDNLNMNHANSLDEHTTDAIESIRECFKAAMSTCDTMKQDKKKRNSQLAAKHQSRIMAMMKANQAKFLSNPNTKQLMVDTEMNESQTTSSSVPSQVINANSAPPEVNRLCILCRDEQKIGFDQPMMVLLAYVQRSSVLSKNRTGRKIPNYTMSLTNQRLYPRVQQYLAKHPDSYDVKSTDSFSFDATFMTSDLFFGPHISTCGHVMHYDCWEGFVDAIVKRENSRPNNRNTRHVSFELEKHEILCPLCECISNITIPLIPNYTRFAHRSHLPNSANTIFPSGPDMIDRTAEEFSRFLRALRATVDGVKHEKHLMNISRAVANTYQSTSSIGIDDIIEEVEPEVATSLRDFFDSIRNDRIKSDSCSENMLSSITLLARRIYEIGLNIEQTGANHARIFMMTSWSVSYTIQSYERSSRFKQSPLFEDLESSKYFCISSLIRFACSSMLTHQSDVMRSLLVIKLRYLLVEIQHKSSSLCFLDIDTFEAFVSLLILLQKLYLPSRDSSDKPTISPSSSDAEWSANPDCAWATRVFDHEYYRNLLHLLLVFNMSQVIITMQNDMTRSQDKTVSQSQNQHEISKDHLIFHNFYNKLIIASGHPNNAIPLVDDLFVSKMKLGLLPFLRSCAILLFHLSGITPPEELSKNSAYSDAKDDVRMDESNDDEIYADAHSVPNTDYESSDREFNAICKYLNLPTDFSLLLKSQDLCDLACAWVRHSRVKFLIDAALDDGKTLALTQISNAGPIPVKFIRQPHTVNRLIDLPYKYSELLDKAFRLTCTSVKNTCATSTMCLICGVMLCSQCYSCQRDLNELASHNQQSQWAQQEHDPDRAGSNVEALSLNQSTYQPSMFNENRTSTSTNAFNSVVNQQLVGSCTYHAYECSAGVGVFLRIRNCQILLLSGRSKGCYMPAPYIDDHGETDFGLLRGNPLHLNLQHYEKLQQMWLTHAIPEQISRTLEYSAYASSVNWHLH